MVESLRSPTSDGQSRATRAVGGAIGAQAPRPVATRPQAERKSRDFMKKAPVRSMLNLTGAPSKGE
jgi:hypothetical protein